MHPDFREGFENLRTLYEETPLGLIAECLYLADHAGTLPPKCTASLRDAMFHLADEYRDSLRLHGRNNTKETRIAFLNAFKREAQVE